MFSSLFRLKSLFWYFLPSFLILHATKIAIICLVELHISGSGGLKKKNKTPKQTNKTLHWQKNG